MAEDKVNNSATVLNTYVNLETTINDKKFIVSIPAGAPFGDTYTALIKSLSIVKGWIDESYKKIVKDKEESATQESATQGKIDEPKKD